MSATRLRNGVATVPVPGTRVALTDEAGAISGVLALEVQALSTNEGTVVVGGPNVVAAPGTHAAPTQKGVALAAGGRVLLAVADVASVFVDVVKAGDGVSWLAQVAS